MRPRSSTCHWATWPSGSVTLLRFHRASRGVHDTGQCPAKRVAHVEALQAIVGAAIRNEDRTGVRHDEPLGYTELPRLDAVATPTGDMLS